jgi:hypothetical protein
MILQIFSNRTNSKQEQISIPCCPRIGGVENLSFFESANLIFFKCFFLLYPYSNQLQLLGFRGWDKILMITLISSKKLGGYKIMKNMCENSGLLLSELVAGSGVFTFSKYFL